MRQDERFYELTEALSAVSFQVPFIASLLYDKMDLVLRDDIPTLATDGNNIFINKKYFCEELVIDHRMAALAHETLHAMFFHPQKMNGYQRTGLFGEPFCWMRFNIAADFIINAMIKNCELGMIHPDWLWSKEVFEGDQVEDIYRRLTPPPQPPPPPSGGGQPDDEEGDESGEGEGGGGPPSGPGQQGWTLKSKDGKRTETFDAPSPHGGQDQHIPEQSDISEIEWKTAAKGAAIGAKSMGKLPASLERLIDGYVEPKRDWKEILRDAITVRAGFDNINWRRPNKRRMYQSGIYFPTRQSWIIEQVAIIEDCSGSITPIELKTYRGAVVEILTQCRPKEVLMLSVDARVNHHDMLYDPEDILKWQSKGGGGTDMEAGFRWIDSHGHAPDVCIVLTDGHTGFSTGPGFPVIWVSTSKAVEDFPYGEAIMMDDPNLENDQ